MKEKKLKTAAKAANRLVPLHKQVATGNGAKRKSIKK